jgi:8-oxo-dGTP pyrophosphatase MutT (NUDIX family)
MLSVRLLHEVISSFDAESDQQTISGQARALQLLEQAERSLDRENYSPGHFTASGVVLSAERTHVLLVHHRRLGRWLQPGGHIEPDDTDTAAAAAREVAEETGIQPRWEVAPVLIGIDVHEIPASGRELVHLHFDLVWRFVAPAGRVQAVLDPHRAVWCRINELESYQADVPLRRAVERALRTR